VDHESEIEHFTLFMLHHAGQKRSQQASTKIKDIQTGKKLQNLFMIDGFGSLSVHLKHARRGLKAQKSSLICK
jgi:hypothetical protein